MIRSKVWFPNIDKITEKLIKSCVTCQAVDNAKHKDPICVRALPGTPFENIDVDFAGPFPNGKYIFIAVDEYSRFPIAEVVNSTSFEHIQPILEKTFALMGIPKVLLSDNGPPFNGIAIKEFLDTYGVKHRKITPYWPEANGITERFVKTLKKSLICSQLDNVKLKKSLICSQLDNVKFGSELQQFLLTYRSTPHATTKKTPYELVFKREIHNLLPSISTTEDNGNVSQEEEQQRMKHKTYADNKRKTRPHNFQIGDQVLYKIPKANALTPAYDPSPYTVIEIKGTQYDPSPYTVIEIKAFFVPDSDPIIPSLKPSTHINPPLQVSPSMNLNELPEDSPQEDPAQDRNEDTKQHRTRRRPQYLEDYVCDSDSLNEAGEEM
ncbi:Integrase core domain [Popillia japonica]|uniref:Integrase core domain n=1 Tax=Popillia japonica TaxID=7064 RepID=A0AAW1JWC9_POPJA